MKTVIFLDDEPQVLHGLERAMEIYADDWEMEFSSCARSVLETMSERHVDAVVTDMRMPGMDGGQVIEQLHRKHPEVARIVLSGQSSREATFRTDHPMHLYLSKPCKAAEIYGAIRRALTLQDLLNDKQLKALCAKRDSLPTRPELYEKVRDEMTSADPSIRAAGEIVATDIGMSARILQMANSAQFGLRREVADAVQAAVILGMETVRDVVLTMGVTMQYAKIGIKGFTLEAFFDRCLAVARRAKGIVAMEGGNKAACEQAFTAGLLHDIGLLALMGHSADDYREVLERCRKSNESLWECEQAVFGAAHPAIGAFVLGQWGLPHPVVEAVGFHHSPDRMRHKGLLPVTAVHVAAAFESRKNPASLSCEKDVDMRYLQNVGCADRLPLWEKV